MARSTFRTVAGVFKRRGLSRFAPLAVLATLWLLMKFGRALLPPLFPTFQRLFGVGTAETGLLFALLMTSYGLMQFPSGILADRVRADRVIAVGLVVAVVAALGLAAAPSFAVLVAAATLFGFGSGVHKTVAMTAISTVYPDRQAGALGVFDTVGFVGGATAPLVLVALAALATDWRAAFAGMAVLAAVTIGLNRLYVTPAVQTARATSPDDGDAAPDPTEDDDPTAGVLRYVRELRQPLLASFVGAVVCYSTVWNATVAFLPLYLIEVKGFTPQTANLLYSGFMFVGLVQMPAGRLTDRVGEVPVLVGAYLVALGGLGALVFSEGLFAVGAAGIVFGVAMHGVRPARGSYLLEVFPDGTSGGGLGLVRSLMVLVGAGTTAVVGAAADVVGLGRAFLGVVVIAGLALVMMIVAGVLDRYSPEPTG